MSQPYIAPIVEGHGEVHSVRGLLLRIASTVDLGMVPTVNSPIRVKSGSFLNDEDYFRRHVMLASAKAEEYRGFVLILLDCDDYCPAQLGPDLLRRSREVRRDVPIVVALAHREYETWFLSAAVSLRGKCGLPGDLDPPASPEAIRDAKGWLSGRMPNRYDPVTHQPSLTNSFDLCEAAKNPSFRRLLRVIRAQLRTTSLQN